MVLTNSEKQKRFRERQKPYLKIANDFRLVKRRVDYLKANLLDVKEKIECLLANLENVFNED